jgi:protein-tyrosine-phosphatase
MSEVVGAVSSPNVLSFFKILADDTRLAIVRLLALTDLRAGELVEKLQQPQNAVSYHLKQLRSLGVLRDRRSTEDGRDVYYSVDLERLQLLYATAGAALHPALTTTPQAEQEQRPTRAQPLRILFLCTHNRARSQLAEGIARYLGGDQVEVYSAGDKPTEVHPLTIAMLEELGIDTSRHYAKHMNQFLEQQFDYIITTCDYVRGNCPTFPGDPERMHWSFDDPSTVAGGAEAQRKGFRTARRELLTRIRLLLSLPHPVTGERLPLRSTRIPEEGGA